MFAAEIAGYIRERVWHESQALEDGPDGSVRLTMEVAPGFELKSWIKGFLPHVEGRAARRRCATRSPATSRSARKAFPAPSG